MNMQLRQLWQYFARAKPDFSGFFYFYFYFFLFKKKPKVFKKSQNFKTCLQKLQSGNPATQELRMCIKYA